ncbi:MAG: sigma-54-dependent Fis family transcriptional regulator [Deltaproteobacteria bacterium]|jgi:two-component system response regulator PilR (NtrC family)|nr:sigma-54-dependent Fis family transcriptional regulator [Deltaproteobacteria bacterium]
MPAILVVDDELSMREFLKILLEKEGYQVSTAPEAAIALDLINKQDFNLVISDIKMPGMGGLTLLEKIKEINNTLPVIMITAFASPDNAVIAMKSGAFDYITKPFKVDEILKIIKSAISAAAPVIVDEITSDTESFEGIIGNSHEMVKIYNLISRIAPTPASILIYGESGTGKELVAQAIHNLSKVSDNPFVPITCSAIPESLLESELFGHVKGAFTGAISNKIGLFELADGGSVFLDEIGELTPLIQTKLLRVLQERELKRVGGTDTIKVNVRIIAATNKNLENEIMEGRFRKDLFYRLAVVPIRVPPLRERKRDVPLLVKHFLKKYSDKMGKEVQEISSYAMKVLMDYDYPGNVRELENIIERGVALESSNIILPESLTLSTYKKEGKPVEKSQAFIAVESEDELYDQGLDEVMTKLEKQMIEHALGKTDNSKIRAAELLKISFRSLRYKVQKYDIK